MPSDRIARMLSLVEGQSVLDVGFADGLLDERSPNESRNWLHGYLRQSYSEIWGIDLGSRKVAQLAELGYSNLIVADAQDFDLGRTFDTVVAGELIEHLPSPGRFLDMARKHLAPGGRIVLSTPFVFGAPNLFYAWVKYPTTVSNPEHTMWFCPTTISYLAERSGLTVDLLELVDDFVAFDAKHARFRIWRRLYSMLNRLLPLRFRALTMVVVLSDRHPD